MINKNSIVLFQGDSITDCGRNRDTEQVEYNTGLGHGYAQMITADIKSAFPTDNINFLNRGISGNRVVDLYARWKVDGLNLNPDILSILIGVNDTWHHFMHNNGVETDRFEMMYRHLLDWTKEVLPNVTLVLMEPFVLMCGVVTQDWVAEIKVRQDIVKKLSEEYGTYYVPLQELLTEKAKLTGADYWLRDGVHPTLAGHKLIADKWLEIVNK